MEAHPVDEVLDLVQLDRILSHIPDPASAAVVRARIVAGCDIVEQKRHEAEALRIKLQEKKDELEREIAGLKGSQAKLNRAAKKTGALPGRVGNLIKRFDQMSLDLKQESSNFADKLEVMQRASRDEAAQTFQVIKDDIAESMTRFSRTALSSERNLTAEIARVTTLAASAADQQTLLGTLTCHGDILRSLATQAQVQALAAKIETIQKSIDCLPSKIDILKALEEAGSYRDFKKFEELLETLKMESQSMRAENEALKSRVASLEARFAKLESQHAAGQD